MENLVGARLLLEVFGDHERRRPADEVGYDCRDDDIHRSSELSRLRGRVVRWKKDKIRNSLFVLEVLGLLGALGGRFKAD